MIHSLYLVLFFFVLFKKKKKLLHGYFNQHIKSWSQLLPHWTLTGSQVFKCKFDKEAVKSKYWHRRTHTDPLPHPPTPPTHSGLVPLVTFIFQCTHWMNACLDFRARETRVHSWHLQSWNTNTPAFQIEMGKVTMLMLLSRFKQNKTKEFFTCIKNTSCQPTPQSQVVVTMRTHTKLMGIKCWLAWTHVLLADLEKHVVSQYPVFLSCFPLSLLMTA